MNGLPAETTQSWFFVKALVALSPIFTFWIADIIAWFLRRTLGGAGGGLRPGVSRPATSRRCSSARVMGQVGGVVDDVIISIIMPPF